MPFIPASATQTAYFTVCPNCRQKRASIEFSCSTSAVSGRQGWCRDCHHAYYKFYKGCPRVVEKTKRKPRSSRHVYCPDWPLVLRERGNGQRWSDELLEILLLYLSQSTFSVSEIAWRCGVSRAGLHAFVRDCKKINPEWRHRIYQASSHPIQAPWPQRRQSTLYVLRKLQSIWGSAKCTLSELKDLRHKRNVRANRPLQFKSFTEPTSSGSAPV